MTDTPFTDYSFPSTGGSANRTVPARFGEMVNVKEMGAKGDGSTDDTAAIRAAIDLAFGTIAAPHAQNSHLNKTLWFPSGHYIVSNVLQLPPLKGGKIIGAGKGATTIESINTAGSDLFRTNGCCYSYFGHMKWVADTSSACFRMYDDHAQIVPGSQANTFMNIACENGGSGYVIGYDSGSSQGSENLFINNTFKNNGIAFLLWNFNALQQTVLGGHIQNCDRGFYYFGAGSAPGIVGVFFENSTIEDLSWEASANDGFVMLGCKSTSNVFYNASSVSSHTIIGCDHSPAANGYFIKNAGTQMEVKGCRSTLGRVNHFFMPRVKVQNSIFGRSTSEWLELNQANLDASAQIETENCTIGNPPVVFKRKRNQNVAGAIVTYDYTVV